MRRLLTTVVALGLLATACTSASPASAGSSTSDSESPLPAVVESSPTSTPPVSTSAPEPSPTPEATPDLVNTDDALGPHEQGRYAFITALPEAGEAYDGAGANVIAVFDTPGGEPRMLVHRRPDGLDNRVPLRNPAWRDEPLVLWPLEITPDQQWIRVQAPIHPQRQSVWVRAEDFEFGYTDYRIEIDVAGQGNLTLFDGDTELLSNIIVSGRESRPTPLGASYIDVVVRGETLSPAYGSYLLSIAIFNDVLGTFGGVLPRQSIHGTNQPELMGQRVASGHIRLPNEVLTFMAEQPGGLVGARVVTVDSTRIDRDQAIQIEESRPWTAAVTTDPGNQSIELADPSI